MGDYYDDEEYQQSQAVAPQKQSASSWGPHREPSYAEPGYDSYYGEGGEKSMNYLTEKELDAYADEYDDNGGLKNAGPQCMCCGIREGMFVNGAVILCMNIGSIFLLFYMVTDKTKVIAVIVGSNLLISSAFIMWFTGIVAAIVSFVTPIALHPYGRRQLAFLNIATMICFLLTVINHGWTASNFAAAKVEEDVKDNLNKTRRYSDMSDEVLNKFAKLGFRVAMAASFNALINGTGGIDRRDLFALPFLVSRAYGLIMLCVFPAGLVATMTIFAGIYGSEAKKKAAEFKARKRSSLLLPPQEAGEEDLYAEQAAATLNTVTA